MKALFATIILVLIGVSLSCQKPETNQLTSQELKIYKTILGDKPKEIVVIDESMVGVFGEISTGKLKEILKGLQNDTSDNFAKANSKAINVENGFTAPFDYEMLSKTEFEKKNLNLSRYYVFSRVGFSDDGKQAVVMFNYVCTALCSDGAYYLLQNNGENWEIVQKSESWKS
jgi:hypothetical protein